MQGNNFMKKISEKIRAVLPKKSAKTEGANKGLNKSIDVKELIEQIKAKFNRNKGVPLEINLVPDVKDEMIKTLKLRNFIFFMCILVASASAGATAIFASVAGGQQAIVDGKKKTIDNLSAKLSSYGDLSDFLTIKDQLGNISAIADNKKLLSRTFGILSARLPQGADSITVSELNVSFVDEAPTFSIEAQANAGSEPFIDYNVLDAFKKSMQYLRYDHGTYKDKEGADIPAYCMIEHAENGTMFRDAEKGIYAYWLITGEGCNPSYEEDAEEEDAEEEKVEENSQGTQISEERDAEENSQGTQMSEEEKKAAEKLAKQTKGYVVEQYEGQYVVRIWRTPQFGTWYSKNPKDGQPTMSLDGTIENVEHFESECMKYSGYDSKEYASGPNETVVKTVDGITWSYTNDTCELVPNDEEGNEGISIYDSSNGRDADDKLVLRFSALVTFNPEVFNFGLKHFMAIGPSNRLNVTDSYVQIQSMFSERAADCDPSDTACLNNSRGGE